ncbi:MAG: COX15/CtaA family protein [Microbacteriaceae bacterium]
MSPQSPAIRTRVLVTGWISFVVNILIVATGGAVRLTGSGLGCPTWPTCNGQSVVTTPEMGVHGIIEFGNRTLTGALILAALAVLWAVWNIRRERRDLWILALIVLGGIVVQALVGGVTVLTGLNPIIVGFHYVASALLVAVTAAFLVRATTPVGARVLVVSSTYARLAHLTSVFVALTVAMGILTTASGPHSGDENAGRTGFDAELLEHVHAWPGYLTLLGTVALFAGSFRYARHLIGWSGALLGVVLVQVGVGLWQARTGLPPVLVGIHMTLAVLLVAGMTVVLMKLKQPVEN